MAIRGKEVEGGIYWETGIDIYTPLYIKWLTNKDLTYNTGNSSQNFAMAQKGK